MQEKISAVYKIVNTVTGDFYIGSSRNVKQRWRNHRCPSRWTRYNSKMYQDMQRYGVEKFDFQILELVEPEHLTQVEQEFIDRLNPTYNNYKANGWNTKRYKDSIIKYNQSEKCKETRRKYKQSEKGKENQRKYQQTEKVKEFIKVLIKNMPINFALIMVRP